MCGIVYAHNRDKSPVNNDVLQQFDLQRKRGVEGFGLFDGQEGNLVREVREDSILKWICKYDSHMLLFHHRYPTSTDNVKRAAHPFTTKDYFRKVQYILVHNGGVYNSKELRPEHEKMGIPYQSVTKDGRFNDSEALLWDFALTMEGKQKELKAKGSIAFVCIKLVKGKPRTLYFARNYNPLKLNLTDEIMRLSSEGEGESILPDKLYAYDYKKNDLSIKPFTVPSYSSTYNNGAPTTHVHWNHQNNQYNRSRATSPGDWLPEHLQKKYGSYLEKRGFDESQIYDYDRDGNPLFSEYDSYDNYYEHKKGLYLPVGLSEEKQEEAEMMAIDENQVIGIMFNYLEDADGRFGLAYSMAEWDYEGFFDTPEEDQDDAYLRDVLTMEAVLERIASDPEYVDEDSISSSWLPLTKDMVKV